MEIASARDLIDWVVIGFTAAGVGIAVWQSIRSGRIATAAKNAVERAEKQLASNQLMGMTPELGAMELELESTASKEDERDKALELLIRWRQAANELVGLLENRLDSDPDLVTAFRTVATKATQAQAAISDGRTSIRVQTKEVRREIAAALGHLSRYAGSLKFSATEGTRDGH